MSHHEENEPHEDNGIPVGLKELPEPAAQLVTLPPDPAPLSLIQQAMNKGILDPGYLEKLLALQERWEDRQAKGAYAQAMNKAQAGMRPIVKNAENSHTGKKYADLEQVLREITPVYLEHGFSVSFGEEENPPDGCVRLRMEVSHDAGHTRTYFGDFPLDASGSQGKANKTGIQAKGSTISYGKRYMHGMVWNLIFTEKEDTDGQTQEAIRQAAERATKVNNAQLEEIRTCIKECNDAGHAADEQKLIQVMKIAKLEDLPREKLGGVLHTLNRKRRGEV